MSAQRAESVNEAAAVVFTIGHSTRPIEESVAMLEAHNICRVVDVRTVPRSRRNPQYGISVLPQSLAARRIEYLHMPRWEVCGGRRTIRRTPAGGTQLSEYADYMQSPEFEQALQELMVLAAEKVTAVMCAEAVPWRCHRSLIADALTVRGVKVKHITGVTKAQPHRLTPFARVDGTRIVYPASEAEP
jgi:uncharacterized protein (DUF488 family)